MPRALTGVYLGQNMPTGDQGVDMCTVEIGADDVQGCFCRCRGCVVSSVTCYGSVCMCEKMGRIRPFGTAGRGRVKKNGCVAAWYLDKRLMRLLIQPVPRSFHRTGQDRTGQDTAGQGAYHE